MLDAGGPCFHTRHPHFGRRYVSAVENILDAAIEVLRKLSAPATDVTLPPADFSPGTPYSNVRAVEAYSYHSQWIKESPEKYQPPTRNRIIQLSANVAPGDYVRARNQLELLRREIRKTFSSVDLLVTPTMPVSPVLIADSLNADFRNTAPFDIFGLPAITVPCGFTGAGLPIGQQICGAPFAEANVLTLAHAYEQATEWHRRSPPM